MIYWCWLIVIVYIRNYCSNSTGFGNIRCFFDILYQASGPTLFSVPRLDGMLLMPHYVYGSCSRIDFEFLAVNNYCWLNSEYNDGTWPIDLTQFNWLDLALSMQGKRILWANHWLRHPIFTCLPRPFYFMLFSPSSFLDHSESPI